MSSSNALGWVFPGAGKDIPSSFSEVNFGPIHYKDTIILEFTPASYTGDIRLYCDYQNSAQGNIWQLSNTGSPLTYKFNQTTPNAGDPNDYHACHFFFAANTASTSSGNTLAFQYLNNASSKAVTWSSSGNTTSVLSTSTSISSTSSQTSSASATRSTSMSTTLSGQASATAGTSSADISQVSQPSGLSGGAIAGIVIGVLALIAIIAGLGFFFGRRVRRNNSEGPTPLPPRDEAKIQPMYQTQQAPGYPQHENYGQQHPVWTDKPLPQHVPNGQRMGEIDGQPVSELETQRHEVYEIGS